MAFAVMAGPVYSEETWEGRKPFLPLQQLRSGGCRPCRADFRQAVLSRAAFLACKGWIQRLSRRVFRSNRTRFAPRSGQGHRYREAEILPVSRPLGRCDMAVLRPCHRGPMRLDPVGNVVQDFLLAEIVEEVVLVPLVELQRLVGRARVLVEVLDGPAHGGLVGGAVQDQQRQGDLAEGVVKPLVGAGPARPRWRRAAPRPWSADRPRGRRGRG